MVTGCGEKRTGTAGNGAGGGADRHVTNAKAWRKGTRISSGKSTFVIETMNRMTPVKDQGRSPLCWAYAMLAVIECDRLALGDSVNLSAACVAHTALMDEAERRYLTRGARDMSLRGMAPMLTDEIMRNGVLPYDAYRSEENIYVAVRRAQRAVDEAVARRTGVGRMRKKLDTVLDGAIGPMPRRVYMYGAEYTPQEFARSVCRAGDYVALTSFTHKPYYEDIVLDVPDNRRNCTFMNLPLDEMMRRVDEALLSGHSVCWEGDTSERGFMWKRGVARLNDEKTRVTQASRQREFETFRTTDDHCMAVVGTARDSHGHRYYVCKNSWGTGNIFGGLLLMSENYMRMKTVCVVIKKPTPALPKGGR